GAAKGADSAFEKGALRAAGLTEIYLPWIGFNRHNSQRYHLPETAVSIAKQFHPAWWKLTAPARKLQARNSLQILGEALNPAEKSLFLLCYTEGGKIQGGTAQGIRLAVHYDIPIFNYGDYEHLPSTIVTQKADAFLSRFLRETLQRTHHGTGSYT
ncbi:MAG: hypothetical protein MN733_23690, partial [Nitrososphaera sp.]|nr:hypothetical protein [Nitrososphaera sp.]